MRFTTFCLTLLAILSLVFAADGGGLPEVYCMNHGNGLFPTDDIQFITTLFCTSDSPISFTLAGKLVFPPTGSYNATYYLKDADGAFSEITDTTVITFSSVSRNNFSVATLELYAKTTTKSTVIVDDKLDFTFASRDADVQEFHALPLHYIRYTTDPLTLFKLDSLLHPAITTETSDEDLQKIADFISSLENADEDQYFNFSLPLMCQQSTAERVKKLGIENLGDMCFYSSAVTYLDVTTGRFFDIYFKSVDAAGQFNFPINDHDSLAIHLSFIGRFKDLEKLTLPQDNEERRELSDLIEIVMGVVRLEDYPTAVYSILRSFGSKSYDYKAEVELDDGTTLKLDVLSVAEHVIDNIADYMEVDLDAACHAFSKVVNFENMFKNAYNVGQRLDSVAPIDKAFEDVLMMDQYDFSFRLTCNHTANIGKSMAYFLGALSPKQITAEMKAMAHTCMVSADTIRAFNEFDFYDVSKTTFKNLPALYFDGYDDYNGSDSNADYRKNMLTYIFDAFTAIAEVVGPSQKAISDYFTNVILDDGTHILETLFDMGSETTSLEFAVKLMRDLYVDPCSYKNPTYNNKAVKGVVETVCACKKVVNFTDTAATCDDVPAGSYHYFPADAVRAVARLCPAGTKQPEINQTACLPCEEDEICETAGVATPEKKAAPAPGTGLPAGAIAGIAIGAVIAVAAVAGVVFFFMTKKKTAHNGNVSTQL